MRQVQLYIKDERIDLFDDESIEVKSSIQDARDINKVFTDYSQTFSIPASSSNNKIFKHFYNHNIDGGFDSRVRHEAKIYINTLLFKKGKIFLEGVDMKNNVAHTYRIKFYGNTISLKDTFGDDTLIALNDYTDATLNLSQFDHEFSYSNVKSIFEGEGLSKFSDDSALIYPLITSKKRLFYSSTLSNTDTKNYDGNIYAPSSGYDVDQYRKRGVKPQDLKPAIKCYHIIKAIQEKYNINFIPDDDSGTKDFFSKHNDAFSNLYLWMSNSSGNITGELADDEYIYKSTIDSWSLHSESDRDFDFFSVSGGDLITGNEWNIAADLFGSFYLRIRPDSAYDSVNWRAKVIDKEDGSFQTVEGSGDVDAKLNFPPRPSFTLDEDYIWEKRYSVEFYSETPMLDTEAIIRFRYGIGLGYDYETYTSGATLDSDTATVSISNHLPDIKVIDFIKGFFSMFNLTAYYIDDETDSEYNATTPVVKVVTLDNYYADAVNNQSKGTIDVTKYINSSGSQVNTSLPFSELNMTFEESDTILIENHRQLTGVTFGDSNLPVSNIYPEFFLGEKYEIELPFSKLKYERLSGTDIQWGYAAGGDFNSEDYDYSDSSDIVPPKGNYNSQNIKSLLFYGIRHQDISENINFSDDSNTTVSLVNDYYRPSNTNETAADNDTAPAFTINFDSEVDEWQLIEFADTNSLFSSFYKKYIESVFDPKKRIFMFTAYLPPSFLIHYKLNDQLKVHDVVYRINSITTNLTTGKTELELINLTSEEII